MTIWDIMPNWLVYVGIGIICLIPIAICAGIIALFVLVIKALKKYLREK